MSMDGQTPKYFGRNSFTRWVVPRDSENTRIIAWANFGVRTDPPRPDWTSPAGIDVLEGGERRDRTPEEAQRRPADYEAFVGQGPIAVHAREHMTAADQGVAAFRARVKAGIRAVANGEAPFQPADLAAPPIPTYCGDTVLRVAPGAGDDETLILEHSRKVLAIIRAGDHLKGEERDKTIIRRLKELEASLR